MSGLLIRPGAGRDRFLDRALALQKRLEGRAATPYTLGKVRALKRIIANHHATERVERMGRAERFLYRCDSFNPRAVENDPVFEDSDSDERAMMLKRNLDESRYLRIALEHLTVRRTKAFVEGLRRFKDRHGEGSLAKLRALFIANEFGDPDWMKKAISGEREAIDAFELACRSGPGGYVRVGTVMEYLSSIDTGAMHSLLDALDADHWPEEMHNHGCRINSLALHIDSGTVHMLAAVVQGSVAQEQERNRGRAKAQEDAQAKRASLEELISDIEADQHLQELFDNLPDWLGQGRIALPDLPEELKSLVRREGFKERLMDYWSRMQVHDSRNYRSGKDPYPRYSKHHGRLMMELFKAVKVKEYWEGRLSPDGLLDALSGAGFTEADISDERVSARYGDVVNTTYRDRLELRLKRLHEHIAVARLRMASLLRTKSRRYSKRLPRTGPS